MTVIGISCKNNGFSYVVLNGTSKSFKLNCCETYPLRQREVEKNLEYTRNQINTIIEKYSPDKSAFMIKKSIHKPAFRGIITVKVPVQQYYIEGILRDAICNYKEKTIKIIEFGKNAKLKAALGKKLDIKISERPERIIEFMKGSYEDLSHGRMNDLEREAFTVAITIL